MDVKTLCLGALTMGDATGYEIRKMFEDGPFAQFFDASYGSIYPALGHLLKDELVSVTQLAQEKRPDKKVYSLTAAGLAHFKKALAVPPTKDKIRSEHVVRLFFADYMSKTDLIAVYQSYLTHFQSQADHLRSLQPENTTSGRLFARGLGLKFYDAMAAYLIENRDQLFEEPVLAAAETTNETPDLQELGND
ncbi:MAG: helix-turn-helix transcriptional regulator [Rhodospirillales bacterium]|nr:helix-turn-helix transcriptional regulator [Rhodospirillales bacterium]